MANIVFFEMNAADEDYLSRHMDRAGVLVSSEFFDPKLCPDPAACEIISVFIHSRINEKSLAALPRVKLIATRSTGYDHIDLDYCRKRGITVCNVPVYGDNTVAEHTFALILALSRKVIQAHTRARTGDFSLSGLQGFDLRGKTLGVVGTGHIGIHVIRIARGFMMKVLALDAHPDKRLADALDFDYVDSLDTLLSTSDIVSLHLPLVPATHHLIGEHNIGRMKEGALLINTARGGLVDTHALLRSLETGRLAGAGLDVFEGETLIKEEKQLLSEDYNMEQLRTVVKNLVLLRHENVIVTPHVAFNSTEALERIMLTTIENIAAYRAGAARNVVA